MLKLLFFDERDAELVRGFTRRIERPRKPAGNPLWRPDATWERGWMSLYGSVVRRPEDGWFQCWYTANLAEDKGLALGYLESEDGLEWRRPELDVMPWKGARTNIVFTRRPHGACVMLDAAEPRAERRYKMLCGADPSGRVSAFVSPDGVRWQAACHNPVIPTNPDCPMSLARHADGRYVVYVRAAWADRRVARAESWDFEHWSVPQHVLEPGPGDPAQLQFYGMGAAPYGAFELGTLWMYHTVVDDRRWSKMEGYQEAELAYSRTGSCWHRAAPGEPFIPHGRRRSWEQGNLQCASAPVYLDDEVRFYYSASMRFHGEKLTHGPARDCGLGLAVSRPDRFVGLDAGARRAEFVSKIVWAGSADWFVNAAVRPGGNITVELLDHEWKPLPGLASRPITGDATALPVVWPASADAATSVRTPVRVRLRACNATLYSVWASDGETTPVYHRFRTRSFIDPVFDMGTLPDWW